MVGIVEGFEEGFCNIEVNGKIQAVPRGQVDSGVKPGDVVQWSHGKWVKDAKQTKERSEHIRKLMDDVWAD